MFEIQNLRTDFHTFENLLVGRICWKQDFLNGDHFANPPNQFAEVYIDNVWRN